MFVLSLWEDVFSISFSLSVFGAVFASLASISLVLYVDDETVPEIPSACVVTGCVSVLLPLWLWVSRREIDVLIRYRGGYENLFVPFLRVGR